MSGLTDEALVRALGELRLSDNSLDAATLLDAYEFRSRGTRTGMLAPPARERLAAVGFGLLLVGSTALRDSAADRLFGPGLVRTSLELAGTLARTFSPL